MSSISGRITGLRGAALIASAWVLGACVGTSLTSPGDAGASGAPGPGGGTGLGADASAPSYIFHVKATTSPFKQTDGYAGQTSRGTKQGIRSFALLRSADDANPVLVFDHGSGYREAGYDDGDDTVVGQAETASIPAGRYVVARVGVTHSRYTVSSTLHYNGMPIPGEFECVQALSDDTELDGTVRKNGWYRYVFHAMGSSYPQEGNNAPLPTSATSGGFTFKTVGGQSYYEYPIELTLGAPPGRDVEIAMVVNMDHGFRWEDQVGPDYAPDVFDTTPTAFEPIRRFGANAASLALVNP